MSLLPHSLHLVVKLSFNKVLFLFSTFSKDSLDLSVPIENVNKNGGNGADRWLARVLSAGWGSSSR